MGKNYTHKISCMVRFTSPFNSAQVKYFNGSEVILGAGTETTHFSRAFSHSRVPIEEARLQWHCPHEVGSYQM